MSQQHILRNDEQAVMTITLNRADRLNAITPEMIGFIGESLTEFRNNADFKVLLVKANGKFFSAGMDISGGMGDGGSSGVDFRNWYRNSLHTLFDEFEHIEKPIVFAIHAPCLGGALEMALSADFRLCSESASFTLPETNLGVIPGSGGTSRLTRIVGTAWAKWMIMAAQKVSAQKAERMGLVHEIYPDKDFDKQVATFVQHLASLPRETMGHAKVTIETVRDLDRASGRNVERMANTWLTMSDEHKSIIEQFSQRKK